MEELSMVKRSLDRTFALWVLMITARVLAAQNLVPNGGFETYSTLPTGYAQLCKATGWTSTSSACTLTPGCGHPDYMHTLGSGGVQAPNTTFGSTAPHSGNGMIGFAAWYLSGVTNFREYPRITLTSPLIPGQSYVVSFWTTNTANALNGWAVNHIGVVFSMAPLTQICSTPITGVVPQYESATMQYSSTWQLHTFTFTAAQAFQNLTIGNFHDDAGTAAQQMATGNMGAYYFLDDVSVTPAIPLPVELIAFEATCRSSGVVLQWTTATEHNNDHFTVERSIDGLTWWPIGTVPGSGTTLEVHQYGFTDPSPATEALYYRVVQTDIDGTDSYSTAVNVSPCMPVFVHRWIVDAQGRLCGDEAHAHVALPPGCYVEVSETELGGRVARKFVVMDALP